MVIRPQRAATLSILAMVLTYLPTTSVGERAASTTRIPGPRSWTSETSCRRYLIRSETLGLLTKRAYGRPLRISMASRTISTRPLLEESRQGANTLLLRLNRTLPSRWRTPPFALSNRLLIRPRKRAPGRETLVVPDRPLGPLSAKSLTTWPLTPIRQLRQCCRRRQSR